MIRYTLLGDGSSDKALMKIIRWAIHDKLPTVPLQGSHADFRNLKNPPRSLEDKVAKALEFDFCDILFIHRDAEQTKDTKGIIASRKAEIKDAVRINCNYVPIIPIKMMETWLLIDSVAITRAAGNPNNSSILNLPTITKLESENNPKEKLHQLLRSASGRKGRRLDSFNVHQSVHLVAEYTNDFSLLRGLTSFNEFERDLHHALRSINPAYS